MVYSAIRRTVSGWVFRGECICGYYRTVPEKFFSEPKPEPPQPKPEPTPEPQRKEKPLPQQFFREPEPEPEPPKPEPDPEPELPPEPPRKSYVLKRCGRCKRPAPYGDKYCSMCVTNVKHELKESGYLTLTAPPRRYRGPEEQEDQYETRYGID